MKAYVYVSLKRSVLDPQGKTIHGALKKMGYFAASTMSARASTSKLQVDALQPRASPGRSP